MLLQHFPAVKTPDIISRQGGAYLNIIGAKKRLTLKPLRHIVPLLKPVCHKPEVGSVIFLPPSNRR